MIVITADKELDIGRIYTDKDIPYFEWNTEFIDKFVFQVIRIATRDEYLKCVEELFGKEVLDRIKECDYFYQISMD